MRLLEVNRNQLVSKSRSNPRFNRRLKQKLSHNTKDFQNIDMNKLFKKDILEADIPVRGETNSYIVTISFEGLLEALKKDLINNKLDLRIIVRNLISVFNRTDIYTHCTCPDHQYRFNYWSTVNRYNATNPEMRPANITNPDDNLGSTCKHGLMVLNNTNWVLKVASVINNYIKFIKVRNPDLYETLIYPALYTDKSMDVRQELENQLSLFDEETEEEEVVDET